jgi:hypothetical protein
VVSVPDVLAPVMRVEVGLAGVVEVIVFRVPKLYVGAMELTFGKGRAGSRTGSARMRPAGWMTTVPATTIRLRASS